MKMAVNDKIFNKEQEKVRIKNKLKQINMIILMISKVKITMIKTTKRMRHKFKSIDPKLGPLRGDSQMSSLNVNWTFKFYSLPHTSTLPY